MRSQGGRDSPTLQGVQPALWASSCLPKQAPEPPRHLPPSPLAKGISRRFVHSWRKTSLSAKGWPDHCPAPAHSPASPPRHRQGDKGPSAWPGEGGLQTAGLGAAGWARADCSEHTQPWPRWGMPDAFDWAWAGRSPQPSGPERTFLLPAPRPGHRCSSCWATKVGGAAPHPRQTEHPCTTGKGKTPRTPETGRCYPMDPPFLLPRPRVSEGLGRVTGAPCTLGCPPLPPTRVVMAAQQRAPWGQLEPVFHPPPSVTQKARGRQAGREGVILDAAPSGGSQSQRGDSATSPNPYFP